MSQSDNANVHPAAPKSPRRMDLGDVMLIVAVILLVVVVVVALVAHARGTISGAPSTDSLVAGGPQASVNAGGLTYTMRLSPGPNFLSEFAIAQLTLSNDGSASYTISGAHNSAGFNQALYVDLSGGNGPTYTLPLATGPRSFPPPPINTFAPGEVWTETVYLPLTASGDVTLTAKGLFTTITQQANAENISYNDGPFTGQLPTLHLSVAPTVPAGRSLTIAPDELASPRSVSVTGPDAALGKLFFVQDESCPGSLHMPGGWQWLDGTSLSDPGAGCDPSQETWQYALAAPGYAIATGQMPAS